MPTESAALEKIYATFITDKGPIQCTLHTDLTPLTVANFVNLVRHKFYDRLIFHRVIKKPPFVAQAGCPENEGTGSPGYQFEDEIRDDLDHNHIGILSMANSGPNTNGSEFFFTLTPTPWLNKAHTVFGEVVRDIDKNILLSIEKNDQIKTIELMGNYEELLQRYADRVAKWDEALARYFPNLLKK